MIAFLAILAITGVLMFLGHDSRFDEDQDAPSRFVVFAGAVVLAALLTIASLVLR